MKVLLIPLIIGLIPLYFLDAAFGISNLNRDMLIRNSFHFVSGLVVLGIWIWHKRGHRFKPTLYLVAALLLVSNIVDYMRSINNLNFEMFIHDFYVLMWGGVTGLFLPAKREAQKEVKE